MAITYPISLPTDSAGQPTNTTFRIRRIVGQSASPFTGEQQTFRHQGEWWEAEVTLPPMKHALAREWVAKLVSMRGVFGTMLLGDWDARTPRGTASSSAGTPLVNGGSQSGNSLVIDGATTSQTGYLKAGDYIQLGSGLSSRLHMVVEDADTDASGNATLSIEPALRTSPSDNTPLTVSNTKGVFRLVTNETEWDANAVSVYGITFAVTEYLT
jgi:hypothetical protein